MTKYFQLALALFFPAIIFLYNKDNSESPFELFKLSFAGFYMFSLLIAYLINSIRDAHSTIRWNHTLSFLTLIVFSNLLSYSNSVNPYLSFWGDQLLPSDSLISILVFYVFSFLLVQFFDDIKSLSFLITSLLLSLLVTSLHGVLQSQGMDPTWSSFHGLVYGTVGNSTGYARLLGALAPLSLAFIIKPQSTGAKIFGIAAFAFTNLALLYTAGRVPIAVNAALLIIYFALTLHKKTYKSNFLKVLAGFLMILLGYLFIQPKADGTDLIAKSKSQYIGKSFEIRKLLAENGIQAWQQKPILGYGPETFSIAQRPIQPQKMNQYQSWEFSWIKAHIEPIQILVCTGLIGLISYLLLLLFTTYRVFLLIKNRLKDESSFFAMAFYFGYLFLLITNLSAFNFIPTQMIAWSFPILMSICLKDSKEFKIDLKQKFISLAGLLLILLTSILLIKTYRHWQADVQYQIARLNFEKKNNNIEAIKYNENALNLNENEPIYYCQKAMIIERTLRNNISRVSEQYKSQVLTEIENELKACVDFAVNRDYLFWLKAEVYGSLYFNQIGSSSQQALKAYDDYLALSPTNPKAHLQKALIHLKGNDENSFQNEIQIALKLKNDFIPAYIELVGFHYRQKNVKAVHELAQQIDRIYFYASDQTEYLGDLVAIAQQNSDKIGQDLFSKIAQKYKNFKDIN